jgi:hypothetical protein
MDKPRDEIERLFRRLKEFRRIFSRFEKVEVMFVAFIFFAPPSIGYGVSRPR